MVAGRAPEPVPPPQCEGGVLHIEPVFYGFYRTGSTEPGYVGSAALPLLCPQWLQAEKRPADFGAVVETLFQVVPAQGLYMDGGPERCRTCSVVGNSGNLKGSRYGGLIDASDFIIRWVRGSHSCVHIHSEQIRTGSEPDQNTERLTVPQTHRQLYTKRLIC